MASGASIGMMDPAYFVGRKAILAWLNETFDMSLEKIEQTASGAVALQILDRIYPRSVPMGKVRWDARAAPDMTSNYKIVQSVLAKKGVDRDIPIERLVRAKYQDNLEMMQWFKHFYEANLSDEAASAPYDAVGRRRLGKGLDSGPACFRPGVGGVRKDSFVGTKRRSAAASASRRAPATEVQPTSSSSSSSSSSKKPIQSSGAAASSSSSSADRKKLAEARVAIDGLERERDFYFAKLRDIEILAQTYGGSDKDFVDQIFKVLYATEDDFVSPEEAEESKDATTPQKQSLVAGKENAV